MKSLLILLAAFPTLAGAITLEAENAVLTGVQVASQVAGYQGSGYVTGFDQAGDQIQWTFQSPGGIHRIGIRFRTPYGMKGFNGSLNGEGFSGYFPASDTFFEVDAGLLDLAAGTNSLTLGGGWNYYQIDAAILTPEAPAPPPSAGPAVPVDPAATPKTRALLASIAARYGQQTFSGQHGIGDFSTIQSASGKLPAILEGDLIDYSSSRVAHAGMPAGYTESLVSQAATGHLLSVMWHWNAPSHLLNTEAQPWWRGFYTEATTFDLAAALADPAGSDYALLLSDIDAIAMQLRKFSDADVPILWRPLHESEGGWFWWGAKGPDAFKQLWRLLHDRLTNFHGLHNLIWVLTSEDPAWYPGNDVVDVIGVDAYPDNHSDALVTRWQPLRTRFDGVKPLALTEFGGVPDIEKMQRLGVWWAWFCSWQGDLGPASESPATIARIYQSPGVITLDEIPPLNEDSNGDGVTDSEATSIGMDPAFDLTPSIDFFRRNADRFAIGHSDADLAAATEAGRQEILAHPEDHDLFTADQLQPLALGHPLLQRDPVSGNFTLKIRLTHSPDLTLWEPLAPAATSLQPDGSVDLTLPAGGNTRFYRIQGESP